MSVSVRYVASMETRIGIADGEYYLWGCLLALLTYLTYLPTLFTDLGTAGNHLPRFTNMCERMEVSCRETVPRFFLSSWRIWNKSALYAYNYLWREERADMYIIVVLHAYLQGSAIT